MLDIDKKLVINYLKKHNFTLQEFCKICNIQQYEYERLLDHVDYDTYDTAQKISDILDVDVWTFIIKV